MTRDEDEIRERKEAAKKKRVLKTKAPVKADPWKVLFSLISDYVEAAIADSWKGGGDPADFEIHELQLKLARITLTNHIVRMKQELT